MDNDELERKINSLERDLDNLRYELERKIRDLESDLDSKASKEHYHYDKGDA